MIFEKNLKFKFQIKKKIECQTYEKNGAGLCRE